MFLLFSKCSIKNRIKISPDKYSALSEDNSSIALEKGIKLFLAVIEN